MKRYEIPNFGISIEAPDGLTLEVDTVYDEWASISGPDFHLLLNSFVPESSSHSLAETEQQLRLINNAEIEVTREEDNGSEWRVDYRFIDKGTYGTSARIGMIDCGVSGVDEAQRDRVAACCCTIRRL
jgi:hypothetical protein